MYVQVIMSVYIYIYMYYKRNYMKRFLLGFNECKNKTLFIKFFPFCMLYKIIKTLFWQEAAD